MLEGGFFFFFFSFPFFTPFFSFFVRPPSRDAVSASQPDLVTQVEPPVGVNNNNNNNQSPFQSRTPSGLPYPARQRVALQHMHAAGRGESLLSSSSTSSHMTSSSII